MITLIHEQRETQWPDAAAEGDALWLDAAAVEAATGWSWKPEGLCRGDLCVPLPPMGERQGQGQGQGQGESQGQGDGQGGGQQPHPFVREGRLNLSAMWRRSGQPVVHDAASRTWVLGTGGAQRSAALATLQAPDFALPDLEGREHRLSSYRGRKVFLATWASW